MAVPAENKPGCSEWTKTWIAVGVIALLMTSRYAQGDFLFSGQLGTCRSDAMYIMDASEWRQAAKERGYSVTTLTDSGFIKLRADGLAESYALHRMAWVPSGLIGHRRAGIVVLVLDSGEVIAYESWARGTL